MAAMAARRGAGQAIDAELVRAGVQAELVGPQGARHGGVPGQVDRQGVQVADVIHALLEAPHEARRQADPLHAQPAQLAGHVNMLGVGGGRFGLVHRDLQLEGDALAFQVAVQAGHVRHGRSILDGGAQHLLALEGQPEIIQVELLAGQALQQVGQSRLERRPGQHGGLMLQHHPAQVAGGRIDEGARVDGEERVTGGGETVDVGRRLQVVGVRAHRALPAAFEGAPGGVGQHLLGRAPGAGQLAHGLLGENRRNRLTRVVGVDLFQGAHVPGGSQPQAGRQSRPK